MPKYITFQADQGLLNIAKARPGDREEPWAFTVDPKADAISGWLVYGQEGGDLSDAHFAALLNFSPLKALVAGDGRHASHVTIDPAPDQEVRVRLQLSAQTLRPGLNCLVLLIQPTRYFENYPTSPMGLRIDLYKGAGWRASHQRRSPSAGGPAAATR